MRAGSFEGGSLCEHAVAAGVEAACGSAIATAGAAARSDVRDEGGAVWSALGSDKLRKSPDTPRRM